jgi:hypothetical protein
MRVALSPEEVCRAQRLAAAQQDGPASQAAARLRAALLRVALLRVA